MALTQPTIAQLTAAVTAFGSTNLGDFLFGTGDADIITGGTATDINSIVSDGSDTLQGFEGDDIYIVKETTDVIIEAVDGGIDTVWSSAAYTLAAEVENIGASGSVATTLTGNAKNNILDGSQTTAVNTLIGGLGSDTYYLGTGDKVTEAAAGGTQDTVIAGFSVNLTDGTTAGIGAGATAATTVANIENVTLTAAAGAANLTGNTLNNHLTGNNAANNISGGLGNDILDSGNGGADTLDGGAGDDTYIIRAGTTLPVAIADSAGIDTVNSFISSIDVSTLTGIQGIEKVTLWGTAVSAIGNGLDNVLTGNNLSNNLFGGSGKDTLIGGGGTDTLDGGDGNDTYVVVSATNIVAETGANATSLTIGGTDAVQFNAAAGSLTLGLNIENIILGPLATTVTNISATGNASNNTMTGNAGNNSLNGGAGDDNLIGNLGNDTLLGGLGMDTLSGGAGTNSLDGGDGNDTYVVVNATDTVAETGANAALAAGGVDLVQYAATATTIPALVLGANIENVTLGGGFASNATGNGLNNVMKGNTAANILIGADGNDTIDGGAGVDSMTGGLGNDSYTVDNVLDVVTELAAEVGADTVTSTVSFDMSTTAAGVETLILAGAAVNGTGNGQDNIINGNAANNNLIGNAGNDSITAAGGNDTVDAGIGNDTIIGGTGRDVVTTGTGIDIIKFAGGVLDTVAAAASIAGVDLYNDLQLNAGTADKIDLVDVVAHANTAVTGSVNTATFIANMNNLLAVGSGAGFDTLLANDISAAVVTANAGTLSGHSFLAVDLNGSNTFDAADFVIEITGSTVTSLTTASFM